MKGVFITGTDTDAGKTVISTAIVDVIKNKGFRVAGMKPIASGCDVTAEGLRNDDAMQLIEHANVELPYELVNPYSFEPAIAPHIAAEQVQTEIDLNLIYEKYQEIQQSCDAVVVEGAGGWLVPINNSQTMADLAKLLSLPVVLVVGIRLGCINHALLSVEVIKQSGLPFLGWVANNVEVNRESAQIISTLRNTISAPLLGEVPYLSDMTKIAVDYINGEHFV